LPSTFGRRKIIGGSTANDPPKRRDFA
jgi:hypothetical protein